MKSKRVLVSVVVAVALLVGVMAPRPARADTETTLIILGSVVGGVAVLAVIMTAMVRGNPAWLPAAPQGAEQNGSDSRGSLRFGPQCAPGDGNVPLMCW